MMDIFTYMALLLIHETTYFKYNEAAMAYRID